MQLKNENEWLQYLAHSNQFPALEKINTIAVTWADSMEDYASLTDPELVETYDTLLAEIPDVDLLSAGDLGEVMAILLQHWVHADLLLEQLTTLERQLVAENITHKIQMMAEDAEARGQQQLVTGE